MHLKIIILIIPIILLSSYILYSIYKLLIKNNIKEHFGAVCTNEYNPVCGKDGITYNNICNMTNNNTTLNYDGICKKMFGTDMCKDVPYLPVCGYDGKTYNNSCELFLSGTELQYYGVCSSNQAFSNISNSSCDNLVYNPVCGMNDVTYKNICELNNSNIELKYQSKCITNYSKICEGEQYKPVCGYNNSNYSNMCHLYLNGVQFKKYGLCEEPINDINYLYDNKLNKYINCQEYAPVCGKDGITYKNLCDIKNTEVKHSGVCLDNYPNGVCNDVKINYVCGTNNITYKNKCEMDIDAVELRYYGVCGAEYENIKSFDKPMDDKFLPDFYKEDIKDINDINLEYNIIATYKTILKRNPTKDEIDKIILRIKKGELIEDEIKIELYNSNEYDRIIKMESNGYGDGLDIAYAKEDLSAKIGKMYYNELKQTIPSKMVIPIRDIFIYFQNNEYIFRAMLIHKNYNNFEKTILETFNINKAKLLELFNMNFKLTDLKIKANDIIKYDLLNKINDKKTTVTPLMVNSHSLINNTVIDNTAFYDTINNSNNISIDNLIKLLKTV